LTATNSLAYCGIELIAAAFKSELFLWCLGTLRNDTQQNDNFNVFLIVLRS